MTHATVIAMYAKRLIDERNSEHFNEQYDAVSISISILFLLRISIGDTFEASVGIEYQRYF